MSEVKNQAKYAPFFHQLSRENQHILLIHGTEMTARAGQTLFYEGEEAKYIYLIQKGIVRLSKMTIENKKFFLHQKQEGDIAGEFSLFNDMSCSMTAEVVSDAVLVKFERKSLEALFSQNGEIATAFIKLFARNTQLTQAKFSDLLLYGKTGALYSILIRFANSYGEERQTGILINWKLTNQDLAHFTGTSRETVNRMLNDLKRSNIISVKKGCILIKDIDFLREHLHCERCPLERCTIS